MKFSLSNLLLVVAFLAVSIAWWADRRQLSHEIEALNAECADLMGDVTTMTMSNGISAMSFPDGKLPPQKSYDFQRPEDRDEYRRIYGHLMSPHGAFVSPVANKN